MEQTNALTTNVLNDAQMAVVTQRTPIGEIRYREGRGGKQLPYVDHAYVTRTLNEAFGWNWDFEILMFERIEGLQDKIIEIVAHGKLTVRTEKHTIVKHQAGCAQVELKRDGSDYVSVGDMYKAAASDALKKCASLLGIALDLYDSDMPPAREGQKAVSQPTEGNGQSAENKSAETPRRRSPMSAVQRKKLIELYQAVHPCSETEALKGLDTMFIEAFKHGGKEASYEESAHLTAQLLAAQRAK